MDVETAQIAFEAINEFIEECIKDRWKDLIHSEGFLQLPIDQLVKVLTRKLKEEELSDFSYSFIQSDLIEGICNWLVVDLDTRLQYLQSHLVTFYCLHQVNGSLAKEVLQFYDVPQPSLGKCKSTLGLKIEF